MSGAEESTTPERTDEGTRSGPRVGAPPAGNPVTRALSRAALRLAGWRLVGEVPDEPKAVLVGAPHSSHLDFVLTKLTAGALGVRLHWVGKKSLFPRPFERLVRWYGGIPVDRSAPDGFVEAMVEEFRRRDRFLLAVMPEGTVREGAQWRSGFLRIAREANVPMLLIGFDWGRRTMVIGPLLRSEPDAPIADEIERVSGHFTGMVGRGRSLDAPATEIARDGVRSGA